jgi:hypothetical protein
MASTYQRNCDRRSRSDGLRSSINQHSAFSLLPMVLLSPTQAKPCWTMLCPAIAEGSLPPSVLSLRISLVVSHPSLALLSQRVRLPSSRRR